MEESSHGLIRYLLGGTEEKNQNSNQALNVRHKFYSFNCFAQ